MFDTNKNLPEYHQTADDNKFYDDSLAKTHANTLKDKTVTPFYRKDYEGKAKVATPKLTADQRIESVNKLETVEAVEEALANEKAKTVLTAGAEKIEALNAAKVDAATEDNTTEDNQ